MRDIRKFYSIDLNNSTDFMKKKRKNSASFFVTCLRSYIATRVDQSYKQAGISEEQLIFYLGALIYPKEVMRIHMKDQKKVA